MDDTVIQIRTHELFLESVHADDDMGYPNDISFIPADQEWSEESAWRKLTEQLPVALVREHDELVIVARPQNLLDRVLGTVRGTVERRVDGRRVDGPTTTRLDRRAVRKMRAAASPVLSR